MKQTQRSSTVLGHTASALVLMCAAVLALTSAVAAADDGGSTFFVSPGESDSNNCTASAPCATITHAVSVAGDGDTVVVKKGVYHFLYTDGQTTGIFHASAVPLVGTVVQDNDLRDVYYGIWTLNVAPIPTGANHFAKDVTVPVFQQ